MIFGRCWFILQISQKVLISWIYRIIRLCKHTQYLLKLRRTWWFSLFSCSIVLGWNKHSLATLDVKLERGLSYHGWFDRDLLLKLLICFRFVIQPRLIIVFLLKANPWVQIWSLFFKIYFLKFIFGSTILRVNCLSKFWVGPHAFHFCTNSCDPCTLACCPCLKIF